MPAVPLMKQFAQISSLSTVISFQETFSKNCTVYIQFQQAATVSRVRLPDWGNSVSVLYLPIQEEMLIHLRLKATKQQEQQLNKIVSQTGTPQCHSSSSFCGLCSEVVSMCAHFTWTGLSPSEELLLSSISLSKKRRLTLKTCI